LIAVQRQHSEAFICVKPIDLGDVVIVEVQILQILVGMRVLDAHYLVAAIVHPLQVGGRCEIEGEPQSVVGGIQLY
jgi:hypothetical protein